MCFVWFQLKNWPQVRSSDSIYMDGSMDLHCHLAQVMACHLLGAKPFPEPMFIWVRSWRCGCLWYHLIAKPNTVGTPYNTAPYITGSNIARLGHGSQNSWSKLWIPIVKSATVRVIFTWKSVPKKSIHGSSDIYSGTQWKQRHDSPWSYHSDVIVTFLWYGTIGIMWHRDHQSTAKKV